MKDKKYFQTFIVRGTGQFPVDMLRYDQCWPIEGMHNIEMSLDSQRRHEFRKSGSAVFEVKLGRWVDHWSRTPTYGRWSSFLWGVSDVKTHVDGEIITDKMVDEMAREVTS